MSPSTRWVYEIFHEDASVKTISNIDNVLPVWNRREVTFSLSVSANAKVGVIVVLNRVSLSVMDLCSAPSMRKMMCVCFVMHDTRLVHSRGRENSRLWSSTLLNRFDRTSGKGHSIYDRST